MTPGYGAQLLQTLLSLACVCALAALVLRLLRRRLTGGARGLRVVARLPLEPRRTIYLVEAAGKFLLVGVGDGAMATLGELSPEEVARVERELAAPPGEGEGIGDLLRRALGGRR